MAAKAKEVRPRVRSQLSVAIPDALRAALDAAAEKDGRSASGYARHLLAKALAGQSEGARP